MGNLSRIGGLVAVVCLALLGNGCATGASRREVVLADLMRDIEKQNTTLAAPGRAVDSPDAPMRVVPTTADKPPAATGATAGNGPVGSYEPLDVSGGGNPLTIQADCILRITVAEDPGLSGSYPVNSLGGIHLGYVGPIILDNLTEETAAMKIRQVLIGREFHSATVTVKILRPSYDRVSIAGSVRRPGVIKIGAGDEVSLNNALNQADGITDTPWRTRVKVVRGGLITSLAPYLPGEVYYLSDEQQKPRMPDVVLRNNDAVFVYSASAQPTGRSKGTTWVLVLGEIGTQGFVGFNPEEKCTMMGLIFKIGNLPPYANDKAVRVIRSNADGTQQEFRVNVREILREGDPALDFPLQSGDRVIVPSRGISIF